MDLKEWKDLWVFMEHEDGQPKGVGLELLNEGKRMAEESGQQVIAVVIGDKCDEVVKGAAEYGADKIILVEGEEYGHYNTDAYANCMIQLINKYKPSAMLIGATINGRDLGPKVACHMHTGLTADCTELEINEEGVVTWIRPALGGNLMGHIYCPDTRPQIGTVRPAVFKRGEHQEGREVDIIKEDIRIPAEDIRMKLLEFVQNPPDDKPKIEEANILVVGGRGMGKEENFGILKELADALGGVVGGSRKAVDAGWITVADQVGQTGKTVSPNIYIACAVSGAIQHTVGMEGSDIIIAINSDPEAPIFELATYSIVGDVFEVVPALTEAVKEYKKQYKPLN